MIASNISYRTFNAPLIKIVCLKIEFNSSTFQHSHSFCLRKIKQFRFVILRECHTAPRITIIFTNYSSLRLSTFIRVKYTKFFFIMIVFTVLIYSDTSDCKLTKISNYYELMRACVFVNICSLLRIIQI